MVPKLEPASWKLVMPFSRLPCTASWICRRASASRSAAVFVDRHCSSARPTRPEAVSRSSPVGRPLASFRISPPLGFIVVRVRFAASIAFAFTKVAWPLACVSITGLSGDTLLSVSWSGKPSTFGFGTLAHFSWCQPRPRIHSPGFACRAASATIDTIWSQSLTSIRSSVIFDWPKPMKWPWLSISPGTASWPRRSMTCVAAPTYGWMAWLVPIATMRSPRTAIAWASGMAASTVTILAFCSTRVAGTGWVCPARATVDRANNAARYFTTAPNLVRG